VTNCRHGISGHDRIHTRTKRQQEWEINELESMKDGTNSVSAVNDRLLSEPAMPPQPVLTAHETGGRPETNGAVRPVSLGHCVLISSSARPSSPSWLSLRLSS
jgi:hypothetical protein